MDDRSRTSLDPLDPSDLGAFEPGRDASTASFGDLGWYVVRCKPREDARALENLTNQGFQAFSPRCVVTRRVGTVRRKVTEPMFPGYVFVELSPTVHDWGVLRSTRGVMYLVRFGMQAPRVPDDVIRGIRELDGLEPDAPGARFKAGDRVRLLDGPFTGMEGVFSQRDGELRAAVLLEYMQRQVRVVVDRDVLAPVR